MLPATPSAIAALVAIAMVFPGPSLAASGSNEAGTHKSNVGTPPYLAGIPLISRKTLFGNPDHAAPRISPDAKQLAYLAPVDGVLNVWVGPLARPKAAKPVTHDTKRGIRTYFWAYNNHQIVYLQDKDGNEDWHVYGVELTTEKTTDFTPLPGVRAEIEKVSYRFPNEILVGLNQRDPEVFDVYRLDLTNGQRQLVQKNTGHFSEFVIDDDYRIRFAVKQTDSAGKLIMQPDGKDGWKTFMDISMDNAMTTGPIGFNQSGDVLYMLDSRGRNTAALCSYNLKTDEEKVLAQNSRADVDNVLIKPIEHTVQAVSFNYERKTWEPLDPAVAEDFRVLRSVTRGELSISSQSLDDRRWIVAFVEDDGPVRFYEFDRPERHARFPLHQPKRPRGTSAGTNAPACRQLARRVGPGQLPVATAKDQFRRPRPAIRTVTDGLGRSRRSLGP